VIVISGALVLVALILLVLGLTMTDLDFVYGSIGVSLVSFVFLVIGILQRRGEQPAPAGDAPQVSDASRRSAGVRRRRCAARAGRVPVTAPATRTARVAAPAPVVVEEEYDDEELEPGGGTVLVVPGRPRYHLEGCRYLTGKSAEEIDVLDAREDGFTPCGVCKPDAALEALALEDEPVEDDVEPAPVDEPTVVAPVADTGVPGTADEVDAAPARPRRTARTGRGSTVLTAAPAETPPVAEAPDSAEPVDDELVPVAPPVAAGAALAPCAGPFGGCHGRRRGEAGRPEQGRRHPGPRALPHVDLPLRARRPRHRGAQPGRGGQAGLQALRRVQALTP
jgi:hypothetical protein